MTRSNSVFNGVALAFALALAGGSPALALTTIQQCGQQYQAAKAANTLNGMTWPQFRTDCTAKLKAEPVSTAPVVTPVPGTGAAAAPVNPLKPAPTVAPPVVAPAPAVVPQVVAAPAVPPPVVAPVGTAEKTTAPVSPGRVAAQTRQRQCGAEWRAQKVSLVAATPGLTWPKYWSACNTRLKAAGQ